MTDLVDDLMQDHLRIAALFERFEDLGTDERDHAGRELVATIATHEFAEEKVVFPALARCSAGGSAIAADRSAEQRAAEDLLADLDKTDADRPEFLASFRELRRKVTAHADAEEQTVFWVLRTNLSDSERRVAAHQYARAKSAAPTRPHPLAPHGAARTVLLGPLVARVDRKRDEKQDGGSPPATWEPAPDAVSVIRADHRRIRLLLDQLERQAEAAPSWVLDELTEQVATHSAAEMELVYPVVADAGPQAHDVAKQGRLDHEEVDMKIVRLTTVPASTAEFRSEALGLVEDLRAHLTLEEEEMLPILESALTADARCELAHRYERVKRRAPDTPHPHALRSALGARISDRLLATVGRARHR